MIGPGRPSVVAVGGLGRVAAGGGVCRAGPGHVVEELLRVLRGTPQELATALAGKRLGVDLVVEGIRGGRFVLLFAPVGVVYRMSDNAVDLGRFRPHITMRGRADQLLGVLFGDIDTAEAVFSGILTLHVNRTDELLPQYPQLVQLVAEEVAKLLRR